MFLVISHISTISSVNLVNFMVLAVLIVKLLSVKICHKLRDANFQGCGLSRDVSVSRRSRDVLTSCLGLGPMRLGSHLGLGAICLGLGLGPVGLILGLGPLRLVKKFCAGTHCACCSCS